MILPHNIKTDEFTVFLPYIYAHGELEKFFQNDLVCTNSLEIYFYYMQIKLGDENSKVRLFGFKAMNSNGEIRDVMIYLWKKRNMVRGLIVDVIDKESLEYAEDCFNSLKSII